MTQMLFIIFLPRFISLRRPALTQNSTRSPFGYPMIFHGLFHHLPTPCRAYKFPDATSFKIALSRLKSATKRFNLVFSFSNPLNRLAWSIRNPPYSLRQRINVCERWAVLDRFGDVFGLNGFASRKTRNHLGSFAVADISSLYALIPTRCRMSDRRKSRVQNLE